MYFTYIIEALTVCNAGIVLGYQAVSKDLIKIKIQEKMK